MQQPMHRIPARGGLNYDEAPFLAIWEVTQSCDLACKHCRAAAQPIAHPDQLTTAEGKALIDQIAAMHVPIFVFTGGDPLKRPDLYELIRYCAEKGVKVAVTPSATPLLTREAIFKMKEAGVVRLGISLDGSSPEIHDAFRGLARRMGAHHPGRRMGRRSGPPHPGPFHHQPPQRPRPRQPLRPLRKAQHRHVERFFPGSGRARPTRPTSLRRGIRASLRKNLRALATASASRSRPPRPCTTGATSCSTISRSGKWATAPATGSSRRGREYEPGAPQADAQTRTHGWATRRVNDGKGFMFVSHTGNVYPSGFLPIHAGNIRQTRRSATFTATRPSSKRCATPAAWKESAGRVNTRKSAAVRARGPTPSLAIRWPRSPAASTSRATGSRARKASPQPSASRNFPAPWSRFSSRAAND